MLMTIIFASFLHVHMLHEFFGCRQVTISHLLDQDYVIPMHNLWHKHPEHSASNFTRSCLRWLFSLMLFKHLLLTVLMMFIRVELEAFVSPNDLMLNAPINKELPSSARARITTTATTALIPADWKQQTGRVIKCQDQHSKRKLKNKTLSWQSRSNAMVLHLNT